MTAQKLAEAIRSAMDLMTTPGHNRPTYIGPDVGYGSTDAGFEVTIDGARFYVEVHEYDPEEDE